MPTRPLALALAAALAACSHDQPAAPARPVPERSGFVVPVTASWVAGPATAGTLELEARLEVAPNLVDPLEVTVTVPAGVTLVGGAPAFRVEPGQSGSLAFPYAFAVSAGASGEILLRADITKEGSGLHARAAHPVGPAPLRATRSGPAATGPSVRLNGRDLGPSVPLKP